MNTNTKMLAILILAFGLLDLSPAVAGQHSNATYVKADATGANNGSSWADAYTDLQLALVSAVPGDEIWVTSGTYAPAGPKGDRIATFQLVSGVGIYGGFSGTETERHHRNSAANVTVLSGDLNSDDLTVAAAADLANEPTRSDNSFHVVTATGADDMAVLDGFIITGGYANESGHDNGGGMINIGQVPSTEGPTLIDCGFEGNFAFWNGGGIYSARSHLNLIHCTFRQNHAHIGGMAPQSAGVGGGGMHNRNADPQLFDCSFTENTTLGQGGGMLNFFGSPTLIGCRFADNHSLGGTFRNLGGGLWLREPETPLVFNCTFFGNSARLGGGMAIIHDSNPTIVNTIFTGNIAEGSDRSGAAIFLNYAGATLINCTLSGNSNEGAGEGGAGINSRAGVRLVVMNCVIWGNISNGLLDRTAQIYSRQDVPDISHSCVQGGWDGGIGNIDADPHFAEPGYWGDINDPNIIVEPDDPNAVWIDSDYHLKSEAGRWTSASLVEPDPNSQIWVLDDVTSPCIDRGDPNSPVGDEPMPNGGIINMGAYGGTREASMSIGSLQPLPPPPPVAYWKLDETEGMVVADSAGDNNGYALGDPIWMPDGGQVDGALEFDGVDDFISAPAPLNPADGPFSVFVWVKGGAAGQAIISEPAGPDWLSIDPLTRPFDDGAFRPRPIQRSPTVPGGHNRWQLAPDRFCMGWFVQRALR